MLAESNGTITKVVLRNNNVQYFLDDVCAALVNSGWTEVTTPSYTDYPWNSIFVDSNPGNNGYCELVPGQKYYWKNTPSLPNEVQRSSSDRNVSMTNMMTRLQSHGIIRSWTSNNNLYNPTYWYSSNVAKDFRLGTNDGELATDYRPKWLPFNNYFVMYRAGAGFYDTEYGEPWMWGYKKFDSPVSPDGIQIRLWVGYQTWSNYFTGQNSYPCFKITSVDEVVDPIPSMNIPTKIIAPKWNPCLDITDKGITWDMICGPYWFYITARGQIGARKWIYGGSIKLFEGYKPYNVSIEEAGYTVVHFDRPHSYHPGQYLTLARVNASDPNTMPNINGKAWQILDVPDDMTVRLILNTAPHSYSDGIAGSDTNPVNAGFLFAPDTIQTGAPRVTTFAASGGTAGCYLWNDTGWTSGGTGTEASSTGSANTHLRLPSRSRKWYGDQYSIFEPIVGWAEFFSSTKNYFRGMLWDSFMVNQAYTLDLETSVNGKNWKQVMDPSSGSSCWIRIP